MQLEDEDEDDTPLTPAAKRRKVSDANARPTSFSTPIRRSARLGLSTPIHPQTTSPRARKASSAHSSISSTSAKSLSDLGEPESSDDDAEALISRPTQRRRAAIARQQTSTANPYREPRRPAADLAEDNWLVEDDDIEIISSDNEPQEEQRTMRSSPSARNKRRKHRRERQELEDDLEDLRDDENELSSSMPRTRGGPVNTQREEAREHFAALKRRRAGEKIPRIYDSDEEADSEEYKDIEFIGQPTENVSDEGSIDSSLDTYSGAEQEETVQPAETAEDDWIVNDGDEKEQQQSRRPRSDIPLEFTQWMTAKPRELFPHIVEWLIKNKIAPAFARKDPIFKLAFQRVNDQVSAQAGSRLISSAWNAEFRHTILARPHIAIGIMTSRGSDIQCDACNHSKRPARYEFKLSGDSYYKDTLEPVDQESEDEDGVQDTSNVDEKGHIIAPETKVFRLGTHCTANAQMGHKLVHWKYHLNETVLGYLEEQGVLSPDQIIARDKMSKRKREKEAEAIVDSMEEIGKIAELWSLFQRDLKDSMLGMEDYQSRHGRSQDKVGVIRAKGPDGKTREWINDKYRERYIPSDSDDHDI
jgi:hypothetical protein